ncbi:MAG: translation initiation factor IF-2 [Proteobacteria bacterium]|nr:translation initiation factor IF-2 [Pseudomonadota bacterium]
MANKRVYEIARELNMTNKEIIDKLNELGYSVLTHTNSLSPEEEAEFKNKLQKKPSQAVEETRIRSTVIRRRRKASDDQQEEFSTEVEPEEKEPENLPDEVEMAETTPEPPVSGHPPEEESPRIEPPEEEEAEQMIQAAEQEDAVEQEVQEEPETSADSMELSEDEISTDSEEVQESSASTAPSEPVPNKQRSLVKKRKDKKDMPAKIIKLGPRPSVPAEPETKPEVPATKERTEAVSPKREKIDAGKPPIVQAKAETEEESEARKTAGKDKKKKGLKKTVEETEEELKTQKKKSSFRKKAVVEADDLYSADARAKKHRKGDKGKRSPKGLKPQITIPKAIKRRIKIDDTIILSELAKRMGIKANEIIRKLMISGVMATVNQVVDFETAAVVASEFEYEVERAAFEEDVVLKTTVDEPDMLILRPPVVTVMGHVDHGKTSLLDAIRKTNVTEFEAGGITQHIGAYNVQTDKGQIIFLDTPGHEAFTAMRSRGASVTDIVILVVAADDGVMPQTIEAINHSKAARVPIIVAINKIDKPNADPDRVQRGLVDAGLTPEDWGGDTIFMKISAKKGLGIDELLEMVLLQAELLELKANPNKLASGHVVEAKLDPGRGPIATVLVQDGTLRIGEPVVCGLHYGRVRALVNDRGQEVESAGPSMPVEIIGINGVPNAGDEFVAVADEKTAKQVSQNRIQKQRSKELARTTRLNLDNLFQHMQDGKIKDLNLIIRADVNGSIEAIKDSLEKLSNQEVKINVLHSATGAIAESDVSLAAVSEAIIIGFNVRPNPKVQTMSVDENVSIRYYNIIYNVIQDIQNAIVGLMASTFEEKVIGNAEVRDLFHVPKIGTIAGCYVLDGRIARGQKVRLVRDGVVLYDGKISSLRRFKDDMKEVLTGFECGIGIENYNDIKLGDIIECYVIEEIKPHL